MITLDEFCWLFFGRTNKVAIKFFGLPSYDFDGTCCTNENSDVRLEARKT
jgi:hypothetical protein